MREREPERSLIMNISARDKLKSHWFGAPSVIVGFLLLQGCSMIGMGWPGHRSSMMDSDYETRGVVVEKIGNTGIWAILMIPSLFPGESSILSVQISDPTFSKPVLDANVEISVWDEHSSVNLSRLPDRTTPGYQRVGRFHYSIVHRFAHTPSEAGILEVEAVVTYADGSVEDVLVLSAAQVVADRRISRQRTSWLTATAIVGGVSMLAIMAFFL